jgi:hypothetical protein
VYIQFASVYIVASGLIAIWFSMEAKRTRVGPSAYSVFNDNCERLAGTFTAEQFDQSLRRGGGVL